MDWFLPPAACMIDNEKISQIMFIIVDKIKGHAFKTLSYSQNLRFCSFEAKETLFLP